LANINSDLEYKLVGEFIKRLAIIENNPVEIELITIILQATIQKINESNNYNNLNFIGDVGN
jgi:hypothetical protein|tara:strand:- start:303 stop:488 length:186 start_codon:yes stop_codon:yes gene_type:complete